MSEDSTSSTPELTDVDKALAQLFESMLDEMVAAGIGITATLGAIKAMKLDEIVDAPDDPS
jgi:peptide deformylase